MQAWLDAHSGSEEYPQAEQWNAAIGQEQLAWLRQKLQQAKQQQERVILFNHFPISTASALPTHLLWNSSDLMEIVTGSGCVCAFISGHFHMGGYGELQGVHFWTAKGILEAPEGQNCFAVVRVYENQIQVTGALFDTLVTKAGFGTEPSRILPIARPC